MRVPPQQWQVSMHQRTSSTNKQKQRCDMQGNLLESWKCCAGNGCIAVRAKENTSTRMHFKPWWLASFCGFRYLRTYFLLLLGLFVVPVAPFLVRHLLMKKLVPLCGLLGISLGVSLQRREEEKKLPLPLGVGKTFFCGLIKMAVK